MKKSNKIIALIICVSITFLLVGCGNSTEDKLIGKWKNTNTEDSWKTIEFLDDESCIVSESGEGESEFQYKATDSKITFTGGDSFSYTIVGDQLIMTEELDEKIVFEKIE